MYMCYILKLTSNNPSKTISDNCVVTKVVDVPLFNYVTALFLSDWGWRPFDLIADK